MSKHQEFLAKLHDLMKEYNAEFDLDYYESGCDCCGPTYEFNIQAGGETSVVDSSTLCSWNVGNLLK